MTVWYDDGSKGTTLYSRYMMKNHLGEIPEGQTVDHINENPSDDRIDNFQLLSKSDNASKSGKLRKHITWYEFICPQCGSPATKNMRDVRHGWKQGKGGPYCSKSCAGKASTVEQYGCKETVCGTNAMYARGCRCEKCKEAHRVMSREWKRKKRGSDGGLAQPPVLGTGVVNSDIVGSSPTAPTKVERRHTALKKQCRKACGLGIRYRHQL